MEEGREEGSDRTMVRSPVVLGWMVTTHGDDSCVSRRGRRSDGPVRHGPPPRTEVSERTRRAQSLIK